jgi:hypothetical protein
MNEITHKQQIEKHTKLILNVLNTLDENKVKDIEKNGEPYEYNINGDKFFVVDAPTVKVCISENYNYTFDKINGDFKRWGKTYEEDPQFSPVFAEIADIEITTACSGALTKINGKEIRKPCAFCYKSNTPNGYNMSFETFKKIIDRTPKILTQIAFGVDSTATSNPDLWKMAAYCREIGIIPNVTVADVSDEVADKLAGVMGACAVSLYDDKNVCYDTVQKLVARGMRQINIHFCICNERFNQCKQAINDMTTDPRLKGMNALVMLSLKKKGRGVNFTPLTSEQYKSLVDLALDKKIKFGFDSCGCKKFFDAVKDHPNYNEFKEVGEPCESTCFSWYIGADAKCYPCSFCEHISGWEDGIDVANCDNFINDVWYDGRMKAFRSKLINNVDSVHGARECPVFEI